MTKSMLAKTLKAWPQASQPRSPLALTYLRAQAQRYSSTSRCLSSLQRRPHTCQSAPPHSQVVRGRKVRLPRVSRPTPALRKAHVPYGRRAFNTVSASSLRLQ